MPVTQNWITPTPTPNNPNPEPIQEDLLRIAEADRLEPVLMILEHIADDEGNLWDVTGIGNYLASHFDDLTKNGDDQFEKWYKQTLTNEEREIFSDWLRLVAKDDDSSYLGVVPAAVYTLYAASAVRFGSIAYRCRNGFQKFWSRLGQRTNSQNEAIKWTRHRYGQLRQNRNNQTERTGQMRQMAADVKQNPKYAIFAIIAVIFAADFVYSVVTGKLPELVSLWRATKDTVKKIPAAFNYLPLILIGAVAFLLFRK